MPADRMRVEKLLESLREVTQKAEELATEVTRALRDERRIGLPVTTDGGTPATDTSKPRRRVKRDRRKAPDLA